MKHSLPNTRRLAEYMHIAYESIADDVGWNTNAKCKVPFEKLPRKNKTVMLRVAAMVKSFIKGYQNGSF